LNDINVAIGDGIKGAWENCFFHSTKGILFFLELQQ
jgi:hypothetical protein